MRTVEVHMKWSETISIEVPDEWPLVSSLDDLPSDCLEQIRPFDPATDAVDIDDDDWVDEDEDDDGA